MIPEGRRLESLAERLRAVEPPMPSPAAKIRGWNLVAASLERSPTVHARGRSLRRLMLATVAVAVLLVAGAVAASASSLPDSPLYPVKGAIEQLRGDLAFTSADKLTYHLQLAQTRLTEAEAMIARHRVDLATQALQAMDVQLQDAAGLVSNQAQSDPALAADLENRLQQAIAVHQAELAGVQGQVTNPTARAAIQQSIDRAQQALSKAKADASNAKNGTGPPGQVHGQPAQTPPGQGQGSKGSATPHPTPKK